MVSNLEELDLGRLLDRFAGGDAAALDELLPLVYRDLRRLAARYLRAERPGHTLEPTALINEAFLRLLGPERISPKDRPHFFALAARAMRRVLVDHARRRAAGKRPDPSDRLTLRSGFACEGPDLEVLALHQALERLAHIHPRQARLVELRYFGGLSNPEAAGLLSVSLATIERDWQIARLWLADKLTQSKEGEHHA